MDLLISKLHQAALSLLSPASIFSLPQLAAAFMIAFAYLAYRQMRRRNAVRPSAILRAMMSRRVLFNRSTYADLFYYFVNTFAVGGLIGWGILSGSMISDTIVRALLANFGACAPSTAPEWALRTGITLVAFLGYELGYYVDHYLKHKIPFLWEFHKIHHSAEVLTPLTVFRVHPIDTLIFINVVAIVAGALHGIFTYVIGKNVNLYLISDTNIITVAFFFLLAHLQHSQFWIPLRGLAGRILLSPAHHQIHHSIDPAHYDRNLGSFLAIWDWMFGTLSVPEKETPRLEFGISPTGQDPHSITALLIAPLASAYDVLGLKPRSARNPAARSGTESGAGGSTYSMRRAAEAPAGGPRTQFSSPSRPSSN
ncbi:MAG TPA: sterol desaturase family protein [Aliidongia sp.]|nr:sterol desaturase family protein [Aliidongia sp.]